MILTNPAWSTYIDRLMSHVASGYDAVIYSERPEHHAAQLRPYFMGEKIDIGRVTVVIRAAVAPQ